MTDLESCPFCGSNDLSKPHNGKRYVDCNGCGCFGPGPEDRGVQGAFTQWTIVEAEAIDAWNRRALAAGAAQPAGVEDARNLLGKLIAAWDAAIRLDRHKDWELVRLNVEAARLASKREAA